MTHQKRKVSLKKSNSKSFALRFLSAAVLAGISGMSQADCLITITSAECDTSSPNPYSSTLDFSSVTGATVTIDSDAILNTGSNAGITTGDNANIILQSGAQVISGSKKAAAITTTSDSHIKIGKDALVSQTNAAQPTINVLFYDNSIENSGTITNEGSSPAISFDHSGQTLVNDGVISSKGTAISGYGGLTIINSGQIIGGTGTAILFGAFVQDTLILEEGSSITGKVVANSNTEDTFVLGGEANPESGGDTFDVSTIGNEAQYQRFEIFKKQGTSTWTLDGTATQDINWSDEEGTLVFGSSNQGGGTISGNGGDIGYLDGVSLKNAIVLNQDTGMIVNAGAASQSGIISGTGAMTKTGEGLLILSNDNTYQGLTTVAAGSLQLGNGGTTGMVSGAIVDNGTLIFNHSDDLAYAGIISGTGDITQDGASTLTLTGDNTYTGKTTINSGSTLSLGNGGTTGSVAGNISNSGTLVVNHANSYTEDAVLSGTGSLTQAGAGTLTLTGAGSSQGAVNVNQGTLDLAQNGQFNTGTLNVAAHSTLKLEDTARLTASGAATLNGELDVDISNGGSLITANSIAIGADSALTVAGLSNDMPASASAAAQSRTTVMQTTQGITGDFASVSSAAATTDSPDYLLVGGKKSADNLSYSVGRDLAWTSGTSGSHGNFTLSDPTDHFNVDVTLSDQAANAATGWDGKSLTKAGDGNLTLSAVNTYSGATAVNGGTLTTGIAHALDASSGVNVASEATLDLNGFDQNVNALSGAGSVALGNATLGVVSATTNSEFDGIISGTGGLTHGGASTLTLTGDNTYTGKTTINSGSTLSLGNGGTTGSVAGNISNSGTLVVNHANSYTEDAVLSGTGSLTQAGAGTLTLTGAGSSQGAVNVNQGTLDFAQNGQFNTGTLDVAAQSTLKLEDTARLTASGAATLNGELDVDISTGGPLITANSVTIGTDSALTVAGLSSDMPASASAVAQSRTTVLQTTQGITGDFASVNFGVTDSPDYLLVDGKKSADNLSYSVGNELAWTSGTSGSNGNFTLSDPTDHFNVDVTLSDQAANAATGWDGKSLTKAGDGNLTLSAVNTYSGATAINGGTLTTGVAHALDASSGVNVASGATLDLNGFDQNVNALSGAGNIALGNATLGVVNATANSEFDGVISGAGSLNKTGMDTLVLGGNNTFTGDTTISSGTLQVGNGGVSGALTGNIVNNAALVFNRSDASAYNGVISGTGNVTKDGAGTLTLSGTNTYAGGTVIDNGILSLAKAQAIGVGTALINAAGTLDLAFSNATFANAVSGDGKARISGTDVALGGDNTAFTGAWDITGSAIVTQASQLGSAGVQLDGAGSELALNNFSSDFNNALSGNGKLQINQNSKNDDFTFASSTGSAFTGTVQMEQGNMLLDANGAQALTNATLALSPNGMTTLDADRSIGGLTTGGGTLRINNTPSDTYTLTTQTLDASAGGSIAVNVPATLAPPVIPVDASYFDQDVIRTIQAINTTGTVTGVGNHLSLTNYDGVTPVSTPTLVDISSDGTQLGVATYDYGAVVTSDGAWIGYDLLKLEANAGQTLALQNEPGKDNVLSAQLTGAGNFDVQGAGTVILNNVDNDYTGNTVISSGTLQLGSDNALGNTADVSIANGADLDVNGKTQTITTLHGVAGSSLNMGNGVLTIAQGGVSQGTLTGAGQLNLEGGLMQISGANAGMSATTRIAAPADVELDNTQGLGTGDIALDGTLKLRSASGILSNQLSGAGTLSLQDSAQVSLTNSLNTLSGDINVATGSQLTAFGAGTLGTSSVTDNGTVVLDTATDWTLTNAISGSGGLTKTGSGTLIVNNGLTYSGDTHISQGTLQIGDAPGSLDSTGTVYVETAGTLRGNGSVGGSVVNSGHIGMLSDTPSQLRIAGDLTNNGVVDLTNNAVGNTLTVDGNYNSDGGQLWLNSELNGDSSSTDELIIKGNTSGSTQVTVNNMHGLGEETVNGIEVVNVQGQSDGNFALQGRAVAGAYEYSLYQGTPTENDGNWYLRSQSTEPAPAPSPEPTPGPEPEPTPAPSPRAPVLRPEAGAYLANQSLANSVFLTTMQDRNGGNRQTGEDAPATWAHFDAGRVNSQAAGGAISTGSDTAVLRIGSDIYRHDFGNQQIKAGIMTGYADVDTHSDSRGVSGSTDSNLKGYNFGLYGTWYGGSAEQETGPYVDSWVQYGTFHNSVNGSDLPEEKYHSHNWTGSVEAGYDIALSEAHALYLQPQFQTIYSKYSQGDHSEANGTQIHSKDSGGVTTRLGGRVYGKIDTTGHTEPYVELNWWHGGSSNSIQMDATTVDQNIPVNRYEVKVGAQTNVTENWQLWINTGVQAGKDDYSSVQGQVGGKYSW